MTTRLRILAALLVTVLASLSLPASPGMAAADAAEPALWEHVTVVLKDGWRHRDVAVAADPHGAGLWIRRADGAERLVPRHQVASIHDAAGHDVTAAILAGEEPPPSPPRSGAAPPPPPVAGERAPTPAPRWGEFAAPADPPAATRPAVSGAGAGPGPGDSPLFSVALGAEAGFATGEGDWYEGFEPSWGVGGRLRLTTHERTYLGLGVRHQTLGVEDLISGGDLDVDTRLLVIEGTVGWISRGEAGASRAYLELGAAMIDHEITVASGGLESTVDRTEGAFVGRVGVLVPVGETVAIDLGGTWYYKGLIFAENEPAGSLLGLQAGLTWYR